MSVCPADFNWVSVSPDYLCRIPGLGEDKLSILKKGAVAPGLSETMVLGTSQLGVTRGIPASL